MSSGSKEQWYDEDYWGKCTPVMKSFTIEDIKNILIYSRNTKEYQKAKESILKELST